MGIGWDWLVVTTDTLSSRKEAYKYSQKHSISYIEAAANGLAGSVAASPAEWDLEEGDPAGYRTVPVFVGPCAAAAAMASYYVLRNTPIAEAHRVDWYDLNGLKLTEASDE
jgi:molybdopterin/thiamine biosynthesis adenylyltransferase